MDETYRNLPLPPIKKDRYVGIGIEWGGEGGIGGGDIATAGAKRQCGHEADVTSLCHVFSTRSVRFSGENQSAHS